MISRRLLTLIVFSLTFFVTSSDMQLMQPLLPNIREAFSLSDSQAGLLIACWGFGACLASLLGGVLLDRFSAKTVLPCGLLIFIVAQSLNGLASNYPAFAAGRFLTGVASASISLSMTVRIGELFERRRGQALGILFAGPLMATLIGLRGGLFLKDHFGHWKAPFLFLLPCAALLLCVHAAIGQVGFARKAEHGANGHVTLRSILSFLFRRRLWPILGLSFLFGLGLFCWIPVFSLWRKDAFGSAESEIFRFYIVGGLGAVLVSPLAGWLSDHIGRQRVIIVSCVSLVILPPLFPFAGPSLMLMYPLVFISYALGTSRIAPFNALTLEAVAESERGRFTGLRNSIWQFGIGCGGFLGAYIYQTTQDFAPVVWTASALAAACVPLAWMTLKIRRLSS